MKPAQENHYPKLKTICRAILLFIVISVCTIAAKAQQPYTYYKPYYNQDRKHPAELRSLLAKNPSDSNKVKYLLAMADYFLDQVGTAKTDMDSTAVYLKKAYKLSVAIKSLQWQHNTLMEYGQYYAEIQQRKLQQQIYEQAITLARKNGNQQMEANSWFYYYNNSISGSDTLSLNTAIKRATYALALYRQTGDILRGTLTLKSIADFHLQLGDYNKAEQELLQVIDTYKQIGYPDISFSYDLLSAVYNHKGELSKALYYALATIKAYKGNDVNFLGTFTRRVAEAYAVIGKRKESIEWYTKAYQLYNHTFIFVPTYELVTQLVDDRQPEKALQLIQQTIKRFPVKSDPFLFCIDLAYAETYTALGKYNLAAPHFKVLKDMAAKDSAATEVNTLIFYHLTEFYYAQKLYAAARNYAAKAIANKVYVTLPMRIRLYKILYEIDIAGNKPAQAIIHLQQFHKLQDSIFTQEKLNTIERLQIEFNASQKETENELLRKQSQLQMQKLKQAEFIKKTTIAGIVFLVIVLLLLFNRFNLKRRVNKILMTQKQAIDLAYAKLEASVIQKNKLIADKERLIKEVHHRVKNNLQLTMSLLNTQSYYLEDSSAIAAIRESQHRLKSIALIHQKLYQTENVAAININIYIAELLNYLQDSLGDGKKISFELNLCNLETDIGLAVPLGLFLNEAVNNVFKYAYPDKRGGIVKISLIPQPNNWYLLEIKDNGKGLEPDFDYQNSTSLGMTLMQGLSSQIEGELLIKSHEGLSVGLLFENHNSYSQQD